GADREWSDKHARPALKTLEVCEQVLWDSFSRVAGSAERMAVDVSTLKLVIWDLDDTFWRGTLTEGGITAREDTREAVMALSRHGVMRSISSNTDLPAGRQ